MTPMERVTCKCGRRESLEKVFNNAEGQYECDNCPNRKSEDSDRDDLEEDNFQPCENCDLPDACFDFGCAILNGVRKNPPTDGIF